jgi:DNA polymerase-4
MLPRGRLIAHLDMDAFYASVALLRYPELRGKAVVIGGGQRHSRKRLSARRATSPGKFATLRGYAGRGVILTATYEARAFGLRSALGLMKAAAIAPDVILLPSDFDAYRRQSRLFKSAVASIAPRVEDRGIDEIYIDLTDVRLPGDLPLPLAGEGWGEDMHEPESEVDAWWRARDVAKALKAAVHEATGSPARSPSRPTSSSPRSPPSSTSPTGSPSSSPRMFPRASGRCLRSASTASARRRARSSTPSASAPSARSRTPTSAGWSSTSGATTAHGSRVSRAAEDDREVETESEPVSISRETTFDRDLSAQRDRDELSSIFTELCESLAGDLQRKGYAGRTIGIKLRFDNFKTVTRDRTIDAPTQDARSDSPRGRRMPEARRADAAHPACSGVRIGSLSPMS